MAQGKLVHTLEGHAKPIRSLCFSPDSQLLLTASDDGHMKLYDAYVNKAVCVLVNPIQEYLNLLLFHKIYLIIWKTKLLL